MNYFELNKCQKYFVKMRCLKAGEQPFVGKVFPADAFLQRNEPNASPVAKPGGFPFRS